jgi:PAS domain S-box-containing protein
MRTTGTLGMPERTISQSITSAAELLPWLAGLLGAIASLWLSIKYGWRTLRRVWIVLRRLADSLETMEAIKLEVSTVKARQSTLVETHTTPMWSTDANGSLVDANAAYLRMLGKALSEVVGGGWEDSIHPADAQIVSAAWDEAVKARQPFNRRFKMRSSDGLTLTVSVRAFPALDAQGKVISYLGTTTVLSYKPATRE